MRSDSQCEDPEPLSLPFVDAESSFKSLLQTHTLSPNHANHNITEHHTISSPVSVSVENRKALSTASDFPSPHRREVLTNPPAIFSSPGNSITWFSAKSHISSDMDPMGASYSPSHSVPHNLELSSTTPGVLGSPIAIHRSKGRYARQSSPEFDWKRDKIMDLYRVPREDENRWVSGISNEVYRISSPPRNPMGFIRIPFSLWAKLQG
jgi:hypothetical protein